MKLRIGRLYYTLRRLRAEQWFYRAWHPVKKLFWRDAARVPAAALAHAATIEFAPCLLEPARGKYEPADRKFTFQNRAHAFTGNTDWDWRGHGLLWTYSLGYFSWLEDEGISANDRLGTMHSFRAQYHLSNTPKASYPTSRRIIYWIRFLAENGYDEKLADIIFRDAQRLRAFPERHLLGNHFWENACALYAAGQYFNHVPFLAKSQQWLSRVLNDQLLPDGMHCELSPSYHVLLLTRLLHCIQIGEACDGDPSFREKMRGAAGRMQAALHQLMLRDGSLPRLNDVAPEDLVSPAALVPQAEQYARDVKMTSFETSRTDRFELIADKNIFGCPEQPGHLHAHPFTFCLHVDGQPFISDPGTSTYERGMKRSFERSSRAHNIVTIDGADWSDVWASFRMGRRWPTNAWKRTFHLREECSIIKDEFAESVANKAKMLRLYLHPGVKVFLVDGQTVQTSLAVIRIDGAGQISLHPYEWAKSFNELLPAICIEASLNSLSVLTTIFPSSPLKPVHAN